MGNEAESQTGSTLLVLLRAPDDPSAWDAFVQRYGPRIYGWCRQRGLQEADAENVTQEVLLQLVQKLRTFRYDPGKGTFRGWLRALTRHAWADYLAGQGRAGAGSGDPAVLGRLEAVEAREDLLKNLAQAFDLELLEEAQARVRLRVSPRDWQIFQRLAVEGRPGAEVAGELRMTVSAALMAKCRVQKKFREEIRRLGGADPPTREGGP
jgi:RNA polymerase sigma-70 factor (ECF subfamily)